MQKADFLHVHKRRFRLPMNFSCGICCPKIEKIRSTLRLIKLMVQLHQRPLLDA